MEDTQEYIVPATGAVESPQLADEFDETAEAEEPGFPELEDEVEDETEDYYDEEFDYEDDIDEFGYPVEVVEAEGPSEAEEPVPSIADRLTSISVRLKVIPEKLDTFSAKLDQVWLKISDPLVAQLGNVKVQKPGAKLMAGIGTVVIVCVAVGIGAYLIGKGSGEDIDSARVSGRAAGREAGAIKGATEGYAKGFKKGRDRGFLKSYRANYKGYFKRAFKEAGLDVPPDNQIDIPEP